MAAGQGIAASRFGQSAPASQQNAVVGYPALPRSLERLECMLAHCFGSVVGPLQASASICGYCTKSIFTGLRWARCRNAALSQDTTRSTLPYSGSGQDAATLHSPTTPGSAVRAGRARRTSAQALTRATCRFDIILHPSRPALCVSRSSPPDPAPPRTGRRRCPPPPQPRVSAAIPAASAVGLAQVSRRWTRRL